MNDIKAKEAMENISQYCVEHYPSCRGCIFHIDECVVDCLFDVSCPPREWIADRDRWITTKEADNEN